MGISFVIIIFFIPYINSDKFECTHITINSAINQKVLWRNVSTRLICPISEQFAAMWTSDSEYYGINVLCSHHELKLSYFPTFSRIKLSAVNRTHKTECEFYVEDKYIHSQLSYSPSSDYFLSKAFYKDASGKNNGYGLDFMVTFCTLSMIEGFVYTQLNETEGATKSYPFRLPLPDFLQDEHVYSKHMLDPRHIKQFGMEVKVRQTLIKMSLDFHKDFDECSESAVRNFKICEKNCINMLPSYRCEDDLYIHENCNRDTQWQCPKAPVQKYEPVTKEMQQFQCYSDDFDECQTSNGSICQSEFGPSLSQCVDLPRGFDCINGSVPRIEYCHHVEKTDPRWNCPFPIDLFRSYLYSSDKTAVINNIIHNLPILALNTPDHIVEVISKNDQSIISSVVSLARARKIQEALTVTLRLSKNWYSSVSLLKLILDVFLRTDGYKLDIPIQGIILKISPEHNRYEIKLDKTLISLQSQSTNDFYTDRIAVAKISDDINYIQQLPTGLIDLVTISPSENDFHRRTSNSAFFVMSSLIHEEFTVKIQTSFDDFINKTLVCDLLLTNIQSTQTCEVNKVSNKASFCICRAVNTRFAIIKTGLVPTPIEPNALTLTETQEMVFTVFNQVFIAISIIGFFLFLILVCYVEEFRFDQFNITLCLIAYTITTLLIPYVKPTPDKISCLTVEVALNYSLLAIFTWMLLSGFNMLVYIASISYRTVDLILKRKCYVLFTFIGYGTPALIIGLWFAYTLQDRHFPDSDVPISIELCNRSMEKRMPILWTLTAVNIFNFLVMIVFLIAVLRNCFCEKKYMIDNFTNVLLILLWLLTFGIPMFLIQANLINSFLLAISQPLILAFTSVFMLALVALGNEQNRTLLCRSCGCCRSMYKTNSRNLIYNKRFTNSGKYSQRFIFQPSANQHSSLIPGIRTPCNTPPTYITPALYNNNSYIPFESNNFLIEHPNENMSYKSGVYTPSTETFFTRPITPINFMNNSFICMPNYSQAQTNRKISSTQSSMKSILVSSPSSRTQLDRRPRFIDDRPPEDDIRDLEFEDEGVVEDCNSGGSGSNRSQNQLPNEELLISNINNTNIQHSTPKIPHYFPHALDKYDHFISPNRPPQMSIQNECQPSNSFTVERNEIVL